jgi:5-methylcytosine-specific restriction protein B
LISLCLNAKISFASYDLGLHSECCHLYNWKAGQVVFMGLHDQKIEGVPQFVSYFVPVIEIMRDLGGQARPRQIFDELIKRHDIPESFLALTNKNGGSKFENRVHFARSYLFKAGIMTSPSRGVWGLTDEGWKADLNPDWAADIFRTARVNFSGDEDEQEAPKDDIVPAGVNHWFVGASWAGDDQTERFLKEGVWQNDHEDKFSKLVRQMKPGDMIAIKASFTRKNDVPFENYGRSASVMRIKAIGTITANRGDGLTVEVDWRELDPPKDWYFYTFRTTVARARVEEDDRARRLVAFTFDDVEQDHSYFLAQPYWAEQFAPEVDPLSAIEAEDADVADNTPAPEILPYTVDDIIADGGFMGHELLMSLVNRLSSKKNLILQGPPGTGKTWLAKRLAKALIGRKSPLPDQLRSVQFHPSLSYEDFVRGYRPSSNGLILTDGIFLQVVEAARAQPDLAHVLIIEEINRGNPAQVFGEMLTLLENTKRSRADAMELAYRKIPGEKIHVPDNLHVIGTMNIADRSLALVDLALRRRFAFVTLEPLLNQAWADWCRDRDFPADVIALIRDRMTALNSTIAQDRALGPQFRVGHSYVTPGDDDILDPRAWLTDIIDTEIAPLLEEYWFDAPERAQDATLALRVGL